MPDEEPSPGRGAWAHGRTTVVLRSAWGWFGNLLDMAQMHCDKHFQETTMLTTPAGHQAYFLWFLALAGAAACNGTSSSPSPGTSADATVQGQAGTSDPPPTPRFTLSPKANSGLCLQPGSGTNGAPIALSQCDGSAGQSWSLTDNQVALDGGKCLDMTGGNFSNGSKPQIWDCAAGNPNQIWALQDTQLKLNGTEVCLDVTDGNVAANTVLQVWACFPNNDNQVWLENPAAAASTQTPTPPTQTPPAATGGGVADVTPTPAGKVQVWLSSKDLSTHLQQQADITLKSSNNANLPTLSVDPTRKKQPLEGMGASLTDSSAYLMHQKMTAAQTQDVMTQLFDPVHGIGLSYLRQPMGASDFSHGGNYSYDDGAADPTLARFSIAHDLVDIIPLLKQAIALNPSLKIMALPWSPPGWMKTSNSMVTGSLKATAFAPLAQYFVKFIQAYAAQGVPIWSVSAQNEPQFGKGAYPTMLLPAADENSFIRAHLGPAIANAKLTTKILGFDHNACDEGGSPCPASHPQTLLDDPGTAKYIHGIAWHCYSGDLTVISAFHQKNPSVPLYETECSGGGWQNGSPSFLDAEMWLLFRTMNNWMRSTITWNVALDPSDGPTNSGCTNCRGVVTVNPSNGAVTYNAEFYALGHLSKFWRPGANVIDSTGVDQLNKSAYINTDGSQVLLVQNSGGGSLSFWVKQGSQGFEATLASGAVATYIWK